MPRYTDRNDRSDEEESEDGRRRGSFRREYDDNERDFLDRSRRRDQGEYGRAYGGGFRGSDFESGRGRFGGSDQEERRGSQGRHGPMGSGRWEDEDRRGRRGMDDDEERQGYWSQSQRGEFRGEYGYGRMDETQRGRGEDDFGRGRGMGSERPRSRERFGRYEDEERFSRPSRRMDEEEPWRRRASDREEDSFRGRGRSDMGSRSRSDTDDEDQYVGGRHVGGNIGQSQMDYNEQGYRRGGRGSSRWEDEDVVTSRGGRDLGDGGRHTRGRQSSVYDLEDEERASGSGRRSQSRTDDMGRRTRSNGDEGRRTTSSGRKKTGSKRQRSNDE